MTTEPETHTRATAWTGVPALQPLPPGVASLGQAFLAQVKQRPNQQAIADSRGQKRTYRELCQHAVALSRVLGRTLGPGRHVGLLLPPSVPSAIANVAVTLLGKIPVNLNYSVSETVVNACVAQCDMSHVLTSRLVLEKAQIHLDAPTLLLEDMPARVSKLDRAVAGAVSYAPGLLGPLFLPGVRGNRLAETATIIFTSGSTGDPKGVMLSHGNVLSNMTGIEQHVNLTDRDVVLGILPFFHSFGFTVTLWTVLGLGLGAVYHFNPLDAKIIGQLAAEYGATVMAGTPTFLRAQMHRCTPDQFQTIRLLILGAEKLKPELEAEIEERLRVVPLQGYGCTETGPVVSVNVPMAVRARDGSEIAGNQSGTVGRPLPGTWIRTVSLETGEVLPEGGEGMIEVKGPQVMQGYLNKPEATAEVLRDGWYTTGDVGFVDSEGFLSITDRISRFAKIGGEMVPHHGVESAIEKALGTHEGSLVVTSVPDPKRGERLFVIHTGLPVTPEQLCSNLLAEGTPRLWIPSPADFVEVDELPVLGSGKLDLREVRKMAAERSLSAETG